MMTTTALEILQREIPQFANMVESIVAKGNSSLDEVSHTEPSVKVKGNELILLSEKSVFKGDNPCASYKLPIKYYIYPDLQVLALLKKNKYKKGSIERLKQILVVATYPSN
jgi:hypothetical protein